MNLTEIAAWWGAGVATLVFAWDIFKWKQSGPVINISAAPNMETFGGVPDGLEGKTLVVVEATNTGSQKTTITHLAGLHYKTIFHKLINKNNKSFFVANPGSNQPYPFILVPGERWLGCIEQNNELEEMSRNGLLYCGVYHSGSKKAALQRVIIKNKKCT